MLKDLDSPHLIKPIAAYKMGEEWCLIFPWAGGGNLRDYWRNFERKSRETKSLQWIIFQLIGMSSALKTLHARNCRHGDLKPENILWFKDSNDMGTWQIADVGLAAFHDEAAHTNIRRENGIPTFTPSGTSRYEPPEMDRDRGKPEARSRQYDIWSMGCILLEQLIWLTYGYSAVEIFGKCTKYFWQLQPRNGYMVHPYVVSCMNVMDTQLQDNTAYKELLHLVRTKLLVVEFSDIYESKPEHREVAEVLLIQLEGIQRKCQTISSYLVPIKLEYPSDEISDHAPQPAKPGTVFKNATGLAMPPRIDAPKSPQPSLRTHVPGEERVEEGEQDGFRMIVRTPTLDFASDSGTRDVSRGSDHQEVGEPNHFRKINLQC